MAPSLVRTRVIHPEQLACTELGVPVAAVLQQVIGAVHYIKPNPLRARLFTKLGSDMGSEHVGLLFHTEARWLSRGWALERFFNCCRLSLSTRLCGSWNGELKDLDIIMQGDMKDIVQERTNEGGFRRKLAFWGESLLTSPF